MTITTTVRKNTYAGSGTTGPFSYTFKIFLATHLKVKIIDDVTEDETVLVYGDDYTVTGAGETAGGTVTTTDAVAVGTTISIERYVSLLQETSNLQSAGNFLGSSLERALDWAIMIDQQLSACIYTLDQRLAANIVIINNILIDIDVFEDYMTTNDTDLDAINAAIAALDARIDVLEATVLSLQAQIDALDARLDTVEAALGGGGSGGLVNPMTHAGDMIIGDTGGIPKRLAYRPLAEGPKFLVTGGSVGEEPAWYQLVLADMLNGAPVPVTRIPTIYSTPGSFTHTVSAGVTRIEVELWGGGGGGGLNIAAGCGAGGGYAFAVLEVEPEDEYAVVVGAGGNFSATPTSGGTSSFDGTVLVASGGEGGKVGQDPPISALGGIGSGTATNKLVLRGQGGIGNVIATHEDDTDASDPMVALSKFVPWPFHGGDAPRGGKGGSAQIMAGGTGTPEVCYSAPPTQPGGGGAAAFYPDIGETIAEQDGADGMVIVWEYR